MYSGLTYDVMKSYLTFVWDKKICNGYIAYVINIVFVMS